MGQGVVYGDIEVDRIFGYGDIGILEQLGIDSIVCVGCYCDVQFDVWQWIGMILVLMVCLVMLVVLVERWQLYFLCVIIWWFSLVVDCVGVVLMLRLMVVLVQLLMLIICIVGISVCVVWLVSVLLGVICLVVYMYMLIIMFGCFFS